MIENDGCLCKQQLQMMVTSQFLTEDFYTDFQGKWLLIKDIDAISNGSLLRGKYDASCSSS